MKCVCCEKELQVQYDRDDKDLSFYECCGYKNTCYFGGRFDYDSIIFGGIFQNNEACISYNKEKHNVSIFFGKKFGFSDKEDIELIGVTLDFKNKDKDKLIKQIENLMVFI